MTQPRLIEPGSVYLVTRRTVLRFHLFAPDPRMRRIFLYSLAVASERYGILVHGVVLMSTHEHLVVSDPEGRLPDFLQYFHRLVALGTKQLRDWEGSVWDHEPTSVVELRTPQAVVESLGYLIANPTAAGLVPNAKDWPGVTTRPADLGTAVWRIERPEHYFRADDAKWRRHVELRLVMPRAARELGVGDDELRAMVAHEVAQLEQAARAKAKESGVAFLGADRCAKLSPFRRARSEEPARSRNPCFAVGRGNREALLEAARRLRAFRVAYRFVFERWRTGLRDLSFPAGTWLVHRRHGARVETPARADTA